MQTINAPEPGTHHTRVSGSHHNRLRERLPRFHVRQKFGINQFAGTRTETTEMARRSDCLRQALVFRDAPALAID